MPTISTHFSRLAAAATLAAAALAPATAHAAAKNLTAAAPLAAPTAAAVATDPRPFAATSFWNTPLAADAPIDAASGTYLNELGRQLKAFPSWINTTSYSTPVYTVPAGQPTVRVQLDEVYNPNLQAAWAAVPIPANAAAAKGTDQHLTVWQPSTDTMWEFWLARKAADGWHARYGGRMLGVSTNPGYFTAPKDWGATATSLPLLGGLVRTTELASGQINHALALSLPDTKAGSYVWPAQRTDGNLSTAAAIPEGTRFRIGPQWNLDTFGMPPATLALAKAAQKYGMVVRDRAASISLYAEDPTPTGLDPYVGATGLFGGKLPSELLGQFPWWALQVVKPPA